VGFLHGARSPSLFQTHGLVRVPPLSTPPGGNSADRFRNPLLPSPFLRRLGDPDFQFHEASTERSLVVAARALAHPAQQGFVDGLHPRGSPPPVPSKLCGFDLLPLQDFHLMDP
jgi:hypothetical protein